MMKAKSIKISGKVQGVNFRYYTKQEALRLGIQGTVMNLDDGSVLVRAEGEPEQIEAFINWCKTGPSRARVDGLDIKDVPVEGYAGFVILR
ncbi:MAG TPA: acylphosphatase [Chitinophagaceae bacterium]|nr:acylphosphatase [Chitinophagaceae bacterium]